MKLAIPRQRSFIPLVIFILFLGITGTVFHLATRNANAGVAGWNAGNIINDYVFSNKSTMNAGDIQAFLNSKVPSCDTWGEQTSEFGGGTRRQWAEARGYSPPYTCLKDYTQDGKSAAQIIYDTAQEFTINPQVLIVLLQKEQSLVTDTWPLSLQYRSATGYGCPDTAPCDAEYYGFINQVRWSARMFRAILNNSSSWYTPYVLGNNYIQYSPDSSCGGSNVYIQNRATQALYNYTPYQPNQAALDAGWGTVHCGAYGNRNFYLYFTSWFGSTQTDLAFIALKDPRWMQLKNNARKVDPLTSQSIDDTLAAGRQIRFSSKPNMLVNGQECLRTDLDTTNKRRKCILRSDLEEIAITPEAITETVMRTTANTFKRDLRRGTILRDVSFLETRQLTFTSKVTIGGTTYYLTKYDSENDIERGFLANRLSSSTASYQSITPKRLELKENTTKVIPTAGTAIDGTLSQGMQRIYTSRALVNGQWYYRTENDADFGFDKAIPESKLKDPEYVAFSQPRWMRMKQATQKVAPISGGTTSESVAKGQQIKFSSKIRIDNQWYYRTSTDTTADTDKAIPATYIEEIPYESFVHPRSLQLSQDASKYLPAQETAMGDIFSQGMARMFDAKILINGQWYYRTTTDTKNRVNTAFRATDLEEAN